MLANGTHRYEGSLNLMEHHKVSWRELPCERHINMFRVSIWDVKESQATARAGGTIADLTVISMSSLSFSIIHIQHIQTEICTD